MTRHYVLMTKDGMWAAGYIRRGRRVSEFVPLVIGCATREVAQEEAGRLDRESEARDKKPVDEAHRIVCEVVP